MNTQPKNIYTTPTNIIDSDNPIVIEYANEITSGIHTDHVSISVALYNRVRDDIIYNPYIAYHRDESYKASNIVKLKKGYCVSKASLLCALGRACGIPSRVGFATVRNHIATKQLIELIGTNKFVYHGFTEFYLNDKWVKATPAFDRLTCIRHRVEPLEFNGTNDSIYQQYNNDQHLFMEYLEFHGSYADIPVSKIMSEFRKTYGDKLVDQWIDAFESTRGFSNRRFEQEEVVV
jgi:transglutaminase-like putative cysteine protease